jgi:hypothetical protein
MPRLLKLYPFRFRDLLTGKWQRARYKATIEDIRARYAEWRLDGKPEIRSSAPPMFNPYTAQRPVVLARSDIGLQPQRERPPAIDRLERLLVACFLRRYVTYCARRGHFSAMNGAAELLREIIRSTG